MNSARKAALTNPQAHCINLRAALFHSTPVLERKRSNHNSKRFRRLHVKKSLLRNVSAYADYLFEIWRDDLYDDVPSSSKPSWFKKMCSMDSKRDCTGNRGHHQWGRRGFQFCEDDVGGDHSFWSFINEESFQRRRSPRYSDDYVGGHHFFWSFINEESFQWRHSPKYSNDHGRSWNWRYRVEEDFDDATDSDSSESDLTSDRLALGLSASGPLKLEDVKTAYRASALKWHPDRHQGSSKAVAAEKFKLCSAAYQSLCDRLAVD